MDHAIIAEANAAHAKMPLIAIFAMTFPMTLTNIVSAVVLDAKHAIMEYAKNAFQDDTWLIILVFIVSIHARLASILHFVQNVTLDIISQTLPAARDVGETVQLA